MLRFVVIMDLINGACACDAMLLRRKAQAGVINLTCETNNVQNYFIFVQEPGFNTDTKHWTRSLLDAWAVNMSMTPVNSLLVAGMWKDN